MSQPVAPALQIQESKDNTLLDCLKGIFIHEPHPDELQKDKKILRALENTSQYFLVRLVRLGYSEITGQPFKKNKPIAFELENFDISSLSLTSKRFPLYRCKAFIAHAGTAMIGHYIAYIRMNNNWYLCDDTNVTPVNINEVRDFARAGTIESVYGSNFTPMMFFYEQQ